MQEEWEDILKDVVEQYERGEQLKGLEERNQKLSAQLTEETEKRKRLEDLLGELGHDKGLADEVQKLRSQLNEALASSAQYKNQCAQVEASKAGLLTWINHLETTLNENNRKSEELEKLLTENTTKNIELSR